MKTSLYKIVSGLLVVSLPLTSLTPAFAQDLASVPEAEGIPIVPTLGLTPELGASPMDGLNLGVFGQAATLQIAPLSLRQPGSTHDHLLRSSALPPFNTVLVSPRLGEAMLVPRGRRMQATQAAVEKTLGPGSDVRKASSGAAYQTGRDIENAMTGESPAPAQGTVDAVDNLGILEFADDNNPRKLAAAARIIEKMDLIHGAGGTNRVDEAIKYVHRHLKSEPYSPLTTKFVLKPSFRKAVKDKATTAPKRLSPALQALDHDLETLIPEEIIDKLAEGRIWLWAGLALPLAFALSLYGALQGDALTPVGTCAFVCTCLFGVISVALWVGIIALAMHDGTTLFSQLNTEEKERLQAYQRLASPYGKLNAEKKKTRRAYRRLHSRALKLQNQALRLEGKFHQQDLVTPDQRDVAGEHLLKPMDSQESGMAKLLGLPDGETRQQALKIQEAMIALEAVEMRRSPTDAKLLNLASHIRLLVPSLRHDQSGEEVRAQIKSAIAEMFKRVGMRDNEVYLDELMEMLGAMTQTSQMASPLRPARQAIQAAQTDGQDAPEASSQPSAARAAQAQ